MLLTSPHSTRADRTSGMSVLFPQTSKLGVHQSLVLRGFAFQLQLICGLWMMNMPIIQIVMTVSVKTELPRATGNQRLQLTRLLSTWKVNSRITSASAETSPYTWTVESQVSAHRDLHHQLLSWREQLVAATMLRQYIKWMAKKEQRCLTTTSWAKGSGDIDYDLVKTMLWKQCTLVNADVVGESWQSMIRLWVFNWMSSRQAFVFVRVCKHEYISPLKSVRPSVCMHKHTDLSL